MKNRSYYLFDDMVNIKGFDSINIKIDEKPYKNVLINYIGYMIPNKVKPLYLIINNENRYFEESNRNRYLTLFPTDENRHAEKVLKCGEKLKILLDQQTGTQMIMMKNT